MAQARQALAEGDTERAAALWDEVLAADPSEPEALFHRGNREREAGQYESAVASYRQALLRAPGHAGVLNNLGLAYEAQGRTDQAEACYREVLAASPHHPDALANLANIEFGRENFSAAAATYQRAFATRRDFPASFWTQRAIALHAVGALPDAEQSLREASRLAPDLAKIHVDIGSLCLLQSKFDEAEAAFGRVLELEPEHRYARTMQVYSRMQRCAWKGLDERFAAIRRIFERSVAHGAGDAAVPFPLLAMPLPPRLLLDAAQAWSAQFAHRARSRPVAARRQGSRLRVGFVSADFRDHPTAHLLIDCWERVDRARIETFGYGLLPIDSSALGVRIGRALEHLAAVDEDTPSVIAQRIRDDGIDILIDLNGYTTHARPDIFALRPAPVQINWLGYLGTLGAPWYDYVLTDRFVTPEDQQAFFTERLLFLPHCLFPSDTRRSTAVPAPSRAACGLPERGFVFCCFNTPYKILPPVFDVWMRLLTHVPDSVLWLSPGYPVACANLRREAAARGVDPARLVFAPRVELAEHLARHAHADLFIDTLPYNAGTTANDALFMGVPVVSCCGETMASRIAGSQLQAIGLAELLTTSLAEYEALALRLARQPEELAALRARLNANRRTHPLF
ncbi:MAG TPA: tetratricopeptide repeat protein, partial [Casimicrobiaceae bacterium]